MRVTEELKDARLSIVRAAELANMHVAHFRRLVRRGVFPSPKRTTKGRPYFDYELLVTVAGVLKSGIGKNNEEIIFYRRKPRTNVTRRGSRHPEPTMTANGYLADLAEGLKQVGVPDDLLTPSKLKVALAMEFDHDHPDLATAIPALAQRLLG